jgi:hypothetical protein
LTGSRPSERGRLGVHTCPEHDLLGKEEGFLGGESRAEMMHSPPPGTLKNRASRFCQMAVGLCCSLPSLPERSATLDPDCLGNYHMETWVGSAQAGDMDQTPTSAGQSLLSSAFAAATLASHFQDPGRFRVGQRTTSGPAAGQQRGQSTANHRTVRNTD